MAIALSLSPLAAYGQAYTSPSTNSTASSETTVANDRYDHPQYSYGWIGLLGLLGLTGLMRKRHDNNRIEHSERGDARRSMAGSHREV